MLIAFMTSIRHSAVMLFYPTAFRFYSFGEIPLLHDTSEKRLAIGLDRATLI